MVSVLWPGISAFGVSVKRPPSKIEFIRLNKMRWENGCLNKLGKYIVF